MSKESIRDLTIKALKSALEVNRMEWISVKDKVPEHLTQVLAYELGDVYVAMFCDGKFRDFDKHGYPCDEIENVTHWMPLPEPPKGE